MSLQHRKIIFDHDHFSHYFLCRYIPKSAGSDRLSKSLLSFKSGHSPHRKAWIDCAIAEIRKVRELQESLVIRALAHDEETVQHNTQHSLDQLCVKLAHVLNGNYYPDCLQKIKPVIKLTSLTKVEREAALHNAYRFRLPERMPKRVLIVDDIFTSGATSTAILKAVLNAAPSAEVAIFTLATTEYDTSLNLNVQLKGVPYSWEPATGWMLVAEDEEQYSKTLAKLKEYILNDSF